MDSVGLQDQARRRARRTPRFLLVRQERQLQAAGRRRRLSAPELAQLGAVRRVLRHGRGSAR